jgi:hypothetical protein
MPHSPIQSIDQFIFGSRFIIVLWAMLCGCLALGDLRVPVFLPPAWRPASLATDITNCLKYLRR